jgi:predicted ATP-grasp superfamily ATP-dependent carboligase
MTRKVESLNRTVLLTLGRLPKALDLARALHAAGCRVLVAEPFTRHLTGASRAVARSFVVPAPVTDLEGYLNALERIVESESVSDVIPVSEEILYVSLLRDRLSTAVRLHAMPPAILQGLHDKYSFISHCAQAEVAAPSTALVGSEAAERLLASGPCVVKPRISCSGRGVRVLAQGAAAPSLDEPAIVQQYLDGRVLSSFSMTRHGVVLGTVLYRGIVMQGTVAVAFERLEPSSRITDWIKKIVAHTRFDGFISFDFIEQESGEVMGIECNPRATSGLHFVEPAGLARYVLEVGAASGCAPWPMHYRPEPLLQQFYPCLTETQKSMFGSGPFKQNLATLWWARDVTWRHDDPWPALSMPYTSWPIIEQAIRHQCSFGEVAMLDLMWSPRLPSLGKLA